MGKPNLKMNANELLAFQRDLKQEKELLLNILSKIDNQVHRLQVEQLHLLGLINKSLKNSEEKSESHESIYEAQEQDSTTKSLDLSIASSFKYFQEEDEDDV